MKQKASVFRPEFLRRRQMRQRNGESGRAEGERGREREREGGAGREKKKEKGVDRGESVGIVAVFIQPYPRLSISLGMRMHQHLKLLKSNKRTIPMYIRVSWHKVKALTHGYTHCQ